MATETSIVREAPFLEEARQKLLASATGLAEVPITLPQQQLAPFSSATQQAFGLGQQGLGAYQPFLASAQQQVAASAAPLTSAGGILGGLAERTPQRLEEARLAALGATGDITGRIEAFQSPYQQQVIDAFSTEATRQNELAKQRLRDTAQQQGAFGGSGRFIGEAEAEGRLQQILQQQQAAIRQQGYQTALGAAEREAGRFAALPGQLTGIEQLQYSLPGGVANQQQAFAASQQQLGREYGGLATSAQQLPAADLALLSQIGSQQQQQAQRALDVEQGNILKQTYEPYQRIGFMSDILKGQPSTASTLTQSTDPRVNPLSQILGAGISLAGIFGSGGFGTGYLFGQGGQNLMGAAQGAR